MKRKEIPPIHPFAMPKTRLRPETVLLALGCFSLPLSSAQAASQAPLPPATLHPLANSGHSITPGYNNARATGVHNTSGQNAAANTNNGAGAHSDKLHTNSNNSAINVTTNTTRAASQSASLSTGTVPTAGYKLDLSSITANIVLGSNLFNHAHSIAIDVGGKTVNFTAGQKVTAAEYVAIEQQSGNGQTLKLAANGTADGGNFTLNSIANQKINQLVVPQNVTGLDFVSKNSTITINGELINSGSIYSLSRNAASTGGTIKAQEITNGSGGIISTQLPGSLVSTFPKSDASLNLTLDGLENITNSGTISSSGALRLVTNSGGINNVSSGVNSPGTMATIRAANDVNLSAGSGLITNTGLIASDKGSINITAADSKTNIGISAQAGTFQALNGDINLRTPSYVGSANTTLSGGNYLSKNLNIYSGQGDIESNTGNVSGNLNTLAQTEHFTSSSQNLVLGSNTVDGDPTYVNTGGNIIINAQVVATQNLAIIASGNIVATANGQIVDEGPSENNNVTLVAGAVPTVVNSGGTSQANANLGSIGQLVSPNYVTINFSTNTNGGNIDLSASTAATTIDAHGYALGTVGGTVTLAALCNGNGSSGGQILFNTATTSIDTHGNGPQATGGDIFIYGGNNSTSLGPSIKLGSIVTSGSPSSGSFYVQTSSPASASGQTVEFDSTGTQSNTMFIVGSSAVYPTAQVVVGSINTYGAGGAGATMSSFGYPGGYGGVVSILAGSSITTGNILAFGGGGGGSSTSFFAGAGGGGGGSVNLTSNTASITVNGSINTSGGGGGGTSNTTTATKGGAAGSVLISAPKGPISIVNGIYAVDGAAGGLSPGQTFDGAGGGGGGGGGSYGGGGGGAGAEGSVSAANAGGGGGGGYSGGGGGGAAAPGTGGSGGTGGGYPATTGGGAGGASSGAGYASGTAGSQGLGGAGGGFPSGGGAGGNFGGGGSGGAASSGSIAGGNAANAALNPSGLGANISLSYGTVSAGSGQPLILNASGSGSQSGGTVSYMAPSTTPLTMGIGAYNLQITANGGSTFGNAGGLIVTTPGPLTIGSGGITLATPSGSGNGGSITLSAQSISSGASGPVVLNASGTGSGAGGVIDVIISSNAAQTIGTAAGNFQLLATSGTSGTEGGRISFSTAGNLIVNPAAISVAGLGTNAVGGLIMLIAGQVGSGTLVVNGALNVSGTGTGSGGSIILQSNSTQPFTIGGAASGNGVTGALTAPGNTSSINVANGGGGVEVFEAVSANFVEISAAGNLAIAAPISGTGANSFVDLPASGSILYSGAAQLIAANAVALLGTAGNGTTAAPLSLNAPVVSLYGGAAYVLNAANGGQTLTVPAALTGALSYNGTGNITINDSLTAVGSVSIVSGSFAAGDVNGNITFSQPVIAKGGTSAISLVTGGASSFIENGTGSLQAANVSLQTGSGAIGSSGSPFQLNAINLSVLTSGPVNINDLNSVTLTGASSTSSFTITTPGNLTVGANILPAAASVTLSTSNNGNIRFNGSIGGSTTTSVTVTAEGNGSITGNGLVSGTTTNFASNNGSIFLNINTSNLTVNTTNGQVGIANVSTLGGFSLSNSGANTELNVSYGGPGPWTVNGVSAEGSIVLSGTGNLTIGGVGSFAGNVTINDGLNGGNGNVMVNNSVESFAPAGSVGIFANGTGTITVASKGDNVSAETVTLASSSGTIGSASLPFQIVAAGLAANTSGSVFINDQTTSGVTLTSATTKGGFQLLAQSEITINGGLTSATAIGIFAQNNNGGILFNSTIGITAASVSLGANGSGLIQQTNPQGYVVQGSAVNISGATGGVFVGFNSNNITANGAGIVSLGDFSFAPSTVNASSAGTSFSLGANGSLNLSTITANDGYLNVLSAGSLLEVNSGATETANNGFILLRQADTATGQIMIGSGQTTLQTTGTGGPVELIFGVTVPTPVAGTKPANVMVNNISGGSAYFGTNGISVPAPQATLNLKGSNIQFSTGALPASAIVLGSGVTITADPIGSVVNSGLATAAQGIEAPATSSAISPAALGANMLIPFSQVPLTAPLPSSVSVERTTILAPAAIPVTALAATAPQPLTSSQIATAQTLASNLELISSTLSAPILSALAATAASNSASAQNSSGAIAGISALSPAAITAATGSSPMAAPEYWMPTPRLLGRIPAIFSSDEELNIQQSESTIVDLEEVDATKESVSDKELNGTHQFAKGEPLSGSISHTVSGHRHLKLNTGSVVFVPNRRTLIGTPFGQVTAEAHSVVLIICSSRGLSVFDLDDCHPKSVIVEVGQHEVVLNPGMHTTVTTGSVSRFEAINPAELIGYRSVQTRSLSDGLIAFVAEFSIPQAITSIDSLSKLVNSKHPQAQKVAAHILKTTALLSQMNPAEYRPFVKTDITAYIPEP